MDHSLAPAVKTSFFNLIVSQVSGRAVVPACPRCAYIFETGRYRRAPCPHYTVYTWCTANLLGKFGCSCTLLEQCKSVPGQEY